MTQQTNRGDARLKDLQAKEKERDITNRDNNLGAIQACFVVTMVIAFAFIFKLVHGFAAILELAGWDSAPAVINMFFGMLLVCVPTVGIILTRQIK